MFRFGEPVSYLVDSDDASLLLTIKSHRDPSSSRSSLRTPLTGYISTLFVLFSHWACSRLLDITRSLCVLFEGKRVRVRATTKYRLIRRLLNLFLNSYFLLSRLVRAICYKLWHQNKVP